MNFLVFFAKPLAIGIVMPVAASLGVVWGCRAFFGLRAGIIAARIVLLALSIVPLLLLGKCVRAHHSCAD